MKKRKKKKRREKGKRGRVDEGDRKKNQKIVNTNWLFDDMKELLIILFTVILVLWLCFTKVTIF